MKHYDYIFAGSGLAGLMTAVRMVGSGKFTGKTILIADPDRKQKDDRTWCFWDIANSEWQKLASKKWDYAIFKGASFCRRLVLNPYVYYHISSKDFYRHAISVLSSHANVSFVYEQVEQMTELKGLVEVKIAGETMSCDTLISSIFNKDEVLRQHKYPYLQQHFIGWFIRCERNVFDPGVATFMDFSIAQIGNTRFMYVLPFSENEALVEYTLFSKDLLPEHEYEQAIGEYLQKLNPGNYQIFKKEAGSIPMTAYPFWRKNTRRIIHIGQAGGWTKASTGYTFKNSSRLSSKLAEHLASRNDLRKFHKSDNFWFYDLLLLDILDQDNGRGREIFSSMFESGDPTLIFKFLDEDTNPIEDLAVIMRCPWKPFIKAFVKRLLK